LELRIVPSRHELTFRWSLAKEESPYPGGLPVPLPTLISVGKPFPDFEVELLKGGKLNLGVSRGRICVLNWWNTRCGPCIAEMPGLNTLVRKYQGRIDFIAVNPDPIKEVRAFLAKRTFNYQHALTDTSGSTMFGSYAPRNIVLDRAGIVVFDHGGGSTDTYKTIESVLQRELSK
jgi:peroxiredoxin